MDFAAKRWCRDTAACRRLRLATSTRSKCAGAHAKNTGFALPSAHHQKPRRMCENRTAYPERPTGGAKTFENSSDLPGMSLANYRHDANHGHRDRTGFL